MALSFSAGGPFCLPARANCIKHRRLGTNGSLKKQHPKIGVLLYIPYTYSHSVQNRPKIAAICPLSALPFGSIPPQSAPLSSPAALAQDMLSRA